MFQNNNAFKLCKHDLILLDALLQQMIAGYTHTLIPEGKVANRQPAP
jgi:hypothetical protein